MEKQYIAVTGYYSTGSSAVIDLLKEYDNVAIASPTEREYEHMAFYTRGGLFELLSIITGPFFSNYNADIAISSFLDASTRLNENDFQWFGSYQKYYGDIYKRITDDFVAEISRTKERKSAAYIETTRFSVLKALFQIVASIIYRRPIVSFGQKYVYKKANNAFYYIPDYENLINASKKYVKRYLEMCSYDKEVNVFDHLVLPQQAKEALVVFPQNVKVIIVQRDPRDVFLLNKYYWHKPPVSRAKPYYPTDPDLFIEEWKHTIIGRTNSSQILSIMYEDLIYKYDDTIQLIESFLGLKHSSHSKKKVYFNSDQSIENTQVFECSKEWKNEISNFSTALSSYTYGFPYKRVPNKKLWFDSSLQLDVVHNKTKKQKNSTIK